MVSGQWVWTILDRRLFTNTCISLALVVVALHTSAQYSRTVLKFVLNILTLVLSRKCLEFQMFVTCRDAVLTLSIRAFISASNPPRLSILPPRCVKIPNSSRSPSSVIWLVLSVLYFRNFLPCECWSLLLKRLLLY